LPVTTGGSLTEFEVPTAGSEPLGIASGPDGALWFTEENTGKFARITTAGVITEYALNNENVSPWMITTGPDGMLWFTDSCH